MIGPWRPCEAVLARSKARARACGLDGAQIHPALPLHQYGRRKFRGRLKKPTHMVTASRTARRPAQGPMRNASSRHQGITIPAQRRKHLRSISMATPIHRQPSASQTRYLPPQHQQPETTRSAHPPPLPPDDPHRVCAVRSRVASARTATVIGLRAAHCPH